MSLTCSSIRIAFSYHESLILNDMWHFLSLSLFFMTLTLLESVSRFFCGLSVHVGFSHCFWGHVEDILCDLVWACVFFLPFDWLHFCLLSLSYCTWGYSSEAWIYPCLFLHKKASRGTPEARICLVFKAMRGLIPNTHAWKSNVLGGTGSGSLKLSKLDLDLELRCWTLVF